MHSQNDTVSLLQNEYQFQVLDALANNKETLSKYKRTREEYKSISESYQQLKLVAENAKASYELDDFLYQELLKLNLKEGVEEDLSRSTVHSPVTEPPSNDLSRRLSYGNKKRLVFWTNC